MSSTTETVQTPYGDVEVELVDCDSCGNTVREEDTVEFEIGARTGVACEHCRDEGPVSFPERHSFDPNAAMVVVFAVFSPLLAVISVPVMEREGDDEVAAMLGMFVGGVFYTLLLLFLIYPPIATAVGGVMPL